MKFGKRFLHELETVALWHSYFSFMPFPFTGMLRRLLRPIAKRLLIKSAKSLRRREVLLDLAVQAYDLKFTTTPNPSPAQQDAERSLLGKIDSLKIETEEMYQKLEALWMFLREIRVSVPEWGANLEEFLQNNAPKARSRRKLRNDFAGFLPAHECDHHNDLTALSH
jgi:hypothetical protein